MRCEFVNEPCPGICDVGVAKVVSSDAHRILQFAWALAFRAPCSHIFERSCGRLLLERLGFGLQAAGNPKKAEQNERHAETGIAIAHKNKFSALQEQASVKWKAMKRSD